jgi:GNAT superfamily N-acetyltransferase
MQIIENPSDEQLRKLQEVLRGERLTGIVDIFGVAVSVYLGAEVAGSLVGVASIQIGTEEAELYKLYVIPTYRGKGIGRALVETSIEYLRARNIREVNVEISGDSYGFWQSITADRNIEWYADEKFGISVGG